MNQFWIKKVEHEILHAEKSIRHSFSILKTISDQLPDSLLVGYSDEISDCNRKSEEVIHKLYNRLFQLNRGANG